MKRNKIFALFILAILVWNCKGDDGLVEGDPIELRLMSEVAVENDDEIRAYLETHFYNYEEFESPSADFDYKIRFDTIAGDNADKIAMITQVTSVTIRELSSVFRRTDGEEIDHTLYYLEARPGVGDSPTVGDNVILQYEGTLLNGTAFDGQNHPLSQYLSSTIRGYANGIEKFNAGIGPNDNGDGTVSYDDYGIGAIFIPSGLAYFSAPPNSIIPAYAPLVFKVDVLAFEKDTDFDGDGIPSILEDVNGDGNLNNDNTDGDSEPATVFFANHIDIDDDDDGILTEDEINVDEDGNFVGFRDTDGDGTPDHLDNDN